MATTITFEELINNSVRVYNGMIAVWPQFKQEEPVSTEYVSKFSGRVYAMNNSTIAYIKDGQLYVTPYTRSAMRCLQGNGFVKEGFYVPFSNGDFPKAEEWQWRRLRDMARRSYEDDFVDDCEEYCDEHGIGTLSDETLANCFEMPKEGVDVHHVYYDTKLVPTLNNSCFDCVAVDLIGRFTCNNGRVVFIYRNGKTYVTKGYKICKELRDKGYRDGGLFVPFSNGELPVDPYYRTRWEEIKKN